MISMTLAILGATFLGSYGAVKLCIWEENRKSSTVDEFDYELDCLLEDLDEDLDKLEALDDFDDLTTAKEMDDFIAEWEREEELILD